MNGNAKSNVNNEILTKVRYRKHKDDKGLSFQIDKLHNQKQIWRVFYWMTF